MTTWQLRLVTAENDFKARATASPSTRACPHHVVDLPADQVEVPLISK